MNKEIEFLKEQLKEFQKQIESMEKNMNELENNKEQVKENANFEKIYDKTKLAEKMKKIADIEKENPSKCEEKKKQILDALLNEIEKHAKESKYECLKTTKIINKKIIDSVKDELIIMGYKIRLSYEKDYTAFYISWM